MLSAQNDTSSGVVKIQELESIRGLAALLIVFYHMPIWNALLDVPFRSNGILMVDLFFVLSGFVMFTAYAGKIQSGKDLLRFQFLRFGRLYPVHMLFLLVYVVIELAKYYVHTSLGIAGAHNQPFKENNLTALWQQILLVQAIGPTGNSLTFNWQAWSISVEFYTYLIFGVIILFFRRRMNVVFLGIVLVSLLMLVTRVTFGFTDLARCTLGFFLGCLTAGVVKRRPANIPGYVQIIVCVAIMVFVIRVPSHPFYLLFFFLIAALIATLMLSEDSLLKKVLRMKPLTELGSISYAVYMSHSSIIWGVNQAIRLGLKRPEVNLYPQLSSVETMAAFVLTTLLVLLLSSLVYRWIENPWRERSRRFAFSRLGQPPLTSPQSPASAVAACPAPPAKSVI